MKVLNNFLSATAMAATSEAVAFGVMQGLDMKTILDVLNVSKAAIILKANWRDEELGDLGAYVAAATSIDATQVGRWPRARMTREPSASSGRGQAAELVAA